MKLLLVTATTEEVKPLLSFFDLKDGTNTFNGNSITILTTGVGMVATAWAMGTELAQNSYDVAVNAGIAGSFNRSLDLGTVVKVASDCFSELGAEDGPNLLPIDELGFGNAVEYPVDADFLAKNTRHLKRVSSVTVNCVHGADQSISAIAARLNPDTESMEGAAFFYSCRMKGLPSVQLRSISNYVERRNREAWNVPLAINNLNNELIDLFRNIL